MNDSQVAAATDEELLSLRAIIENELNKREQAWRKRLNALQLARGTAKPIRQRATRSDKGKPKTPRALATVIEALARTIPDLPEEDFSEPRELQPGHATALTDPLPSDEDFDNNGTGFGHE
jgi:hypothetical protein